jgi:ribonuclease BN (tRNA processing enzyme)
VFSITLVVGEGGGLAARQQTPGDVGNPRATSTLTLLGTAGGPFGHPTRAGIASLLTVNDTNYLVDAGEAVVHQIARSGAGSISVVFLTHLHNDHTAGLFSLMSLGRGNLTIFGPPRTSAFVNALNEALAFNAEIRDAELIQGTNANVAPRQIAGKDIVSGVVYMDQNVTVEAIENTHFHITGSPANRNKSYSFKVRTPDRVFVFTGDTGWSDELVRFAAGADVLLSEMVSPTELGPNPNYHMTDEHLSPTQVGRLAAAAKVKMVIASHVRPSLAGDLAEIRRQFSGAAVIGEDLMKF